MKKTKKLVSVILVICLFFASAPLTGFSAFDLSVLNIFHLNSSAAEIVDSGECGENGDNVTWTLDADGVLTIKGQGMIYKSTWQERRSQIKSIIIEEGIKTINSSVFASCDNLLNVTLPISLKTMRERCFNGSGIVSIVIPDSVIYIGEGAFASCDNLTSVTLSKNLKCIEHELFYACRKLSSVKIPFGIKSIKSKAFSDCTSLKTITFPNSVTSIDSFVLENCSALESIAIPDSVTCIGWHAFFNTAWYDKQPDGIVYAGKVAYSYKGIMPENTAIALRDGTRGIANDAFKDFSTLSAVTIPNTVVYIAGGAFWYCTELTSIYIPESVTTIEKFAFNGCEKLNNIIVSEDNPVFHSSNNCLIDSKKKEIIAGSNSSRIPDDGSVISIGDYAFEMLKDLTSITIPNSVMYIGSSAFYHCENLKSIIIQDGVKSIGSGVFRKCENLTSITIPNSVTSIGSYAFYECTKLREVVLPAQLTEIGKSAFYGCTELKSIVIPETVTSIGESAFKNCTSLESLSITNSITGISSDAFENTSWYNTQPEGVVYAGTVAYTYKGTMPDNTAINIKEGTLSVADSAFNDQTNLCAVIIPESTEAIGEFAFSGCMALKSIYGGERIISLGRSAFFNTAWYDTQPDGLVYFGDIVYAYKGTMPDNSEIRIKDGTTAITGFAFFGCDGLVSVILPDSVTMIGRSAFNRCHNLKDVTLSRNLKIIGDGAFLYTALASDNFIIPDGVTEIGDGAFRYTSLKSVVIPGTVDYIEPWLFAGTPIETVIIEQGPKEFLNGVDSKIGYALGAFTSCTSLTTIVLPESIENIGVRTFWNCTNLTEITIPKSVTRIEKLAFDGCLRLQKAIIPNSVEQIDDSAFGNCIGLQDVYFDGTKSQWEKIEISDGNELLLDAQIHFMQNEEEYMIAYNANGGTGAPSAQTKSENESLTLSSAIPTKSYTISYNAAGGSVTPASKSVNCTFKNWNTAQNGGGTSYNPGGTYTANADATLYAQWTNPTAGALPTPTRSGFIFEGWYTSAVGGTKVTSSSAITGNTTLYAHWSSAPVEPEPTDFTWGQDNWNFYNSSSTGDFSSGTYRSQINNTYLNTLKKNLTNSEYQAVFGSNGWLDDTWGGSCYGMSSTALLAKRGYLPYSNYKSGANTLTELPKPTSDSNVNSLITYYQMLQVKSVIQQQYRTVPYRSNEANIKQIIFLLDNNPSVLIGFQKTGWGGHAVLAYGYEYGSFTQNGITYQGCIKICDPNASKAYNPQCNIYFNTQSFQWAIPFYSSYNITSAKGAVFNYIGANVNEINQGGYLTGTSNHNQESYIARIDALAIGNSRTVAKVKQTNGNYMTMNTAPGDIIEDYSYVLGNESEGTIGYNLMDGDAAYMVTQTDPVEMDLTIEYENCRMRGSSLAGKRVIFDKKGYVEVTGESSDYMLSVTFNADYPTDWFTMQVKGSGANYTSLEKRSDGYVFTADVMKNVAVFANNKEKNVTTSFSVNYPSVLIYEIDENTIGIRADADGNGTFETEVKGDMTSVPGDVDGDSKVTASDARLALRRAVNLESYAETSAEFLACDVDHDGKVTANDARSILRAAVGLEELK